MWDCEDLDTISRTNDPTPEFTGTKPSEFKSYREKVRRWRLFTRTPAQPQGPHVLSKLTGPAWDACDELEPEDVATADGVNMILETLAEAFQGEYGVSRSHTACVSHAKEALVESEEQEGFIDVETALAALEQESDTDLEETDVQEILLACKESRQLRGEQRVNCGFRPMTGRTSGGKPYRVGGRLNIGELTSCTRCHLCREKGHWTSACPIRGKQVPRDGEEAKTSFFVYFG